MPPKYKSELTKGELNVSQPVFIVYFFKDAMTSVKMDNKFIF